MRGPTFFSRPSIQVTTTPLDGRLPADTQVTSPRSFASIEEVNIWVNKAILYRKDRTDHWQSPRETLDSGRGDCEDYALLKQAILVACSLVEEQDTYLVVGRDVMLRGDHAVLVVVVDGQNLVLDNVTNNVVPDTSYIDFKPVYSFSGERMWVHGRATR